MLNLRKKMLTLALTAAVLGGGLSTAQAVVRAPDGLGQVLLYPYFTMKNGWQTFIHVTNTSDNTVAAKVRFREAASSKDVLDFILILSPHDMWTAVVEPGLSGKGGVRPTDYSCTSPVIGMNVFKEFESTATEGYVEIIGMGASNRQTDTLVSTGGAANFVSYYAEHQTSGPNEGQPRDCTQVNDRFTLNNISATDTEFTAVGPANFDVLTGKFDLINVDKGWAGAARAVALAEFTASQQAGSDLMRFPQVKLTAPGTVPPLFWADFPNLDSASSSTDSSGNPVWGIFAVNDALNATSVINEWVLNPGLKELSSWIVTFPTKSLTIAAVANINAAQAAVTPAPTPAFTAITNNFSGCQAVALTLYNREEKTVGTEFSGGPGGSELCNEVNVIDFIDSARGVSAANILGSSVSKTIDTAVLNSPFAGGWLNLGMTQGGSVIVNGSLVASSQTVSDPGEGMGHAYRANINVVPATRASLSTILGRPVIGFNITQRSIPTEDAAVYDHAYQRPQLDD